MTKKKETKTITGEVQAAIEKEKFDKETKDTQPDLSDFKFISARIWKPESNEYVMGVYDGNKPYKSDDYEEDATIHFIHDTVSGQRISFIAGIVFDQDLERADVVPGDTIYAQFLGTDDTKSGHRVNIWELRVKK